MCIVWLLFTWHHFVYRLRNQFLKHFSLKNLLTSQCHFCRWKRIREKMRLTTTDTTSSRCVGFIGVQCDMSIAGINFTVHNAFVETLQQLWRYFFTKFQIAFGETSSGQASKGIDVISTTTPCTHTCTHTHAHSQGICLCCRRATKDVLVRLSLDLSVAQNIGVLIW